MKTVVWISAVILAFSYAEVACADDGASKKDDALLASVEAGRLRWFQNVEFCSSFEIELGEARPFKLLKEARFARKGLNPMVGEIKGVGSPFGGVAEALAFGFFRGRPRERKGRQRN